MQSVAAVVAVVVAAVVVAATVVVAAAAVVRVASEEKDYYNEDYYPIISVAVVKHLNVLLSSAFEFCGNCPRTTYILLLHEFVTF